MQQLFFLQSWRAADRRLFLFILPLFLLSIAYYLYAYYSGTTASMPIEIETATAPLRVGIDRFTQSLFVQTVETDSYYITQRYAAGTLQINYTAVYIFMATLFTGIVLAVSSFSALSKYWYLASMTLLVGFFAYLRLDTLQIFGLENQLPLGVVLAIYIGVSYYFNQFAPHITLHRRVAIFAIITLLLGAIILLNARVPNPTLYLAGYGIIVPILFTLLFILLVAFDIPAIFFVLMTDTKSQGKANNMLNFTVLMVLYLGNLLFVYLRNKFIWTPDIIYVNVFWLFIISALVGLWHFKKKEILYKSIMPFEGTGAIFFMAMGIIAFGTIAYTFSIANDPLIEVFEDAILFSHFCFGFVFLLYVFVNYSDIMNKAAQAHRVMYEPRYMSVLALQITGITGLFMVVMSEGKFQYYQSLAGYYNGVATIFYAFDDRLLAQKYYEEALSYEYQNHYSNYALASIYAKNNDKIREAAHYKQALRKQPTPQTYLGLSNYYLNHNQLIQGILTLKEGVRKFPKSDLLYNNMALAYMDTKFGDSTIYSFEQAQNLSKNSSRAAVSQTNMLAFIMRGNMLAESQAVTFDPKYDEYLPYLNNRIALLNWQQKADKGEFNLKNIADSTLSEIGFCYLMNSAINATRKADTTLAPVLRKYRMMPQNTSYSSDLKQANALVYYYAGFTTKGYDLMATLDLAENQGATRFTDLHGKWLSQQGAWPLAAQTFFRTADYNDPISLTNYAAALSENGQIAEAIVLWQKVIEMKDTNTIQTAKIMLAALAINDVSVLLQTEENTRYLALHFRKNYFTLSEIQQIFDSLKDNNIRILAACDLADYSAKNGNNIAAAEYLQIAEIFSPKADKAVVNEYNLRDLRWRQVAKNTPDALLTAIENQPFNFEKSNWTYYFKAIAAAQKNDNTKAAQFFYRAVEGLPFEPAVVLAASNFMNKQGKKQEAYELLVSSLLTNPKADEVRQEYVIQCFKVNLDMAADSEIAKLQATLPVSKFELFKAHLDSIRTNVR